MKVIVGQFSTESNEHIGRMNDLTDYRILFGQQCLDNLVFTDVFTSQGIGVIPACYAAAGPSGVCRREAYDYIESCFLKVVKDHLGETDGMCFFFHGATQVDGLGSGEHHLLHAIRALTGPYLPIAVVCDPHGNLSQQYVDDCTIIRSFRQSPHTDIRETKRHTAQMLVDLLKDRQNIRPVYRRLPLLIGGEQSVSTDEPVRSINHFMDEMEKDPRIRSASWHVGYLRHDTECAGAGIVVIPQTEADQRYAERQADDLAAFVWQRRHEFHYTGLTLEPDQAMEKAVKAEVRPVFITDSGDNVTSGALGINTIILRQALKQKTAKKILFANLRDPSAYQKAYAMMIGNSALFSLGVGQDENSEPVAVEATVLAKGKLMGNWMNDPNHVEGESVLLHLNGTGIDVNLTAIRHNICERQQFTAAGIDIGRYDIVVVKQGYIFPECKQMSRLAIMSLTDGATVQDVRKLNMKKIRRPMYPLDEI